MILTSKSRTIIPFRGIALATVMATGVFVTQAPANAQVLEQGIGGAVVGGVIGGIVGGKKGIGTGAAIGGTLGVLSGAAAAEERRRRRRRWRRRQAAPPPPPAPVYGDNLVGDIQSMLANLGYDPGPIDGVHGERTATAIADYQTQNGIPVTGQPSHRLRNHLARRGG